MKVTQDSEPVESPPLTAEISKKNTITPIIKKEENIPAKLASKPQPKINEALEVVETVVEKIKKTSEENSETVKEKINEVNIITTEKEPIEVAVIDTKPDHANFDQMLQAYVSTSGVVNYRGWKNDLTKLDQYLAELSQNEPSSSWSRSEKMAYWINLYNAGTVKLILDNYPLSSIMNIDGGKPWNRKWIKVGSNTYSLNQIENDIIRPRFGDGRIHFAVNCAAKSCPPLHNRAFTSSNLSGTLARLTRKFVNNTAFNQITKGKLNLSNIFNWYASDFGNIQTFIGQYTDIDINADAEVSFIDYDWALNGR